MKLRTNLLLFASASILLFAQCKKEKNEDPAPTTPTTPSSSGPTTIAEVFAQEGVQVQTGQTSMAIAQTMSMSGVKVDIPSGAFITAAGAPVTGMVDISVKGIFTKKDIILSGAPANSAGKLIATKGCIKVGASQNSQTLRINPGANVIVKIPESGTPVSNLRKYYASQISVTDPTKVWRVANDSTPLTAQFDSTTMSYYYPARLDSVAWLNTGYEWDTIGPVKTGVYAQLDSTYTGTNTVVYISFNGKLIVGAMYYQGNGMFYIGNIPVGTPVYFVAISIKGGTYYKALVSATITNSHVQALTPTSTTLSTIQTQMGLLP